MRNVYPDDVFGPVVHSYSRLQAIEDGVLVDLMQPELAPLVREAGFKFPIAMTTTAFSKAVAPIDGELPAGQDLKGRLWDVLWMLKLAIRASAGGSELCFRVSVWNGRRREVVKLKSVCGPGDSGEPVLTIMLPDED
jgi:hypothetical protein